jgi:phosphoribosylformylglycinamidine synthase
VAGGVGSILSSHQICVTSQNDDPRAVGIFRAAHDLGITSLRQISISDLVFFRGDINQASQLIIEDLLVDPLLQYADWNSSSTTADFIVETSLHPGVTDSTTNELERLAKRMHLPITGVASGKRYAITGDLTPAQLQQFISQLLANPIIERFSLDIPITPAFIDTDATTNTYVEHVQINANTSEQQLAQINKERGLALDPQEMLALQQHFVQRNQLPTDVELETIAQTWSEHCSHKTFRAAITTDDGITRPSLINQLRATTETINAPFVRSARLPSSVRHTIIQAQSNLSAVLTPALVA